MRRICRAIQTRFEAWLDQDVEWSLEPDPWPGGSLEDPRGNGIPSGDRSLVYRQDPSYRDLSTLLPEVPDPPPDVPPSREDRARRNARIPACRRERRS